VIPGPSWLIPRVGGLIDFGQPAALLLVAITHFLTEAEDPAGIIAVFRDALPPGSYLALSHATGDLRPDAAQNAAAVYDQATSCCHLAQPRAGRGAVRRLGPGRARPGPGAVVADQAGKPPRPKELARAWIYGGVARKSR
jgi:S-adenosyl methyltransferase